MHTFGKNIDIKNLVKANDKGRLQVKTPSTYTSTSAAKDTSNVFDMKACWNGTKIQELVTNMSLPPDESLLGAMQSLFLEIYSQK